MKKLFFLLLTGITLNASAQTDSVSVTVIKDPRVSLLVKKQAQINEETTRANRRNMPGFRIQIINTNDRKAAIDAKTKVYHLYPELKAYIQYQSPYYRLKVGNFKTKEEAEEYQSSLSRDFANSVSIVRDVIEVRPEIEAVE
ncbi:MAG: SPOR domain-containing protein [Chitinophagaceae bacterium]